MPYLVSFVRPVIIADREQYINECYVGGDLVLEPVASKPSRPIRGNLQSHQEDRGWLKSWGATRLQVERVDEKYMPR